MLTRRHFVTTTGALLSSTMGIAAFAQDATPESETPLAEAALAEAEPEEKPLRKLYSDSSRWSSWDAQVTPAGYVPEETNPWGFHNRFLPTRIKANPGFVPGDIHVDARARYLYLIEEGGTALRYGVAIARGNLYEPGVYRIGLKKKWPTWRPTEEMVERDPQTYADLAEGMDGGPRNPLGARALYLFDGNRDTYLRIHGTPYPRSIGSRASSGCVRMVMAHIIGLYDNVAVGATAHLYPA